jgi:predicted metal-dependent phosphoesterase TrpH
VKADLHIHSTVSDGSESIEQIIVMAKAKGLDAIAITDHDTFSHIAQIPADAGIQVIGGIEISAAHRKTKTPTHILGYNIQNHDMITSFTQPLLEARNKNSEKQVEILIQAGFQIDREKLARADGKYLYKPHIMDWLVTTGQAPDMFGSFYQKTFKHGGICAFDIEYIDVFEAIKAIKSAGGLAVLAHPGQQKNFWLIPELVKSGLDGLELNHHTHNEEDRETIRNYANQYGLFLTGGSDYHGRYEPQPFGIGDFLSEESGVGAIF